MTCKLVDVAPFRIHRLGCLVIFILPSCSLLGAGDIDALTDGRNNVGDSAGSSSSNSGGRYNGEPFGIRGGTSGASGKNAGGGCSTKTCSAGSAGTGGGSGGSTSEGGSTHEAGNGGEPNDAGNSGTGGAAGNASTPQPVAISLASGSPTAIRGEANGTTTFDACPKGEVLIGLRGQLHPENAWYRKLQGICGVLTLSSQAPYEVSIRAGTTLPLRGDLEGTTFRTDCPQNHIIVGFSGRSGLYIDSVSLRCAPLRVSNEAGQYELTFGSVRTQPAVGGSGGSAFPLTSCADTELATAVNIRTDAAITGFGLGCSRPNLVLDD